MFSITLPCSVCRQRDGQGKQLVDSARLRTDLAPLALLRSPTHHFRALAGHRRVPQSALSHLRSRPGGSGEQRPGRVRSLPLAPSLPRAEPSSSSVMREVVRHLRTKLDTPSVTVQLLALSARLPAGRRPTSSEPPRRRWTPASATVARRSTS